MESINDCPDYVPGPLQGKTMPICKHYIMNPGEAQGACRHPRHFMCERWLGKNAPATAALTKKVLETFDGSKVIDFSFKNGALL